MAKLCIEPYKHACLAPESKANEKKIVKGTTLFYLKIKLSMNRDTRSMKHKREPRSKSTYQKLLSFLQKCYKHWRIAFSINNAEKTLYAYVEE